MVSGHLQEKRGYYYCVLNYQDEFGKRHQKWISTGLTVKGNKKAAEEILMKERRNFRPPVSKGVSANMLYADFVTKVFLPSKKGAVEESTFSGYSQKCKRIDAYFREKKITLEKISPMDIQGFYTKLRESVGATTVHHYHSLMHGALQMALKLDLIPYNPADRIDSPKSSQYIPEIYTLDEMERMLGAVKDDEIGLLIRMTAFYGFRRSEVVGLKWSAIDFKNNSITVKHTVVKTTVDGKKTLIKKDRTKRKASHRTLPLVDSFREELLSLKEKQKDNKKLCGNSYNRDNEDYIFVDAMGNSFDPDYVTGHFQTLLRRNNFKKIRFHDLRHSSASLLLAAGISMKQIQEWLGHSNYSTTANIYAHLEADSKLEAANALNNVFGFAEEKHAG